MNPERREKAIRACHHSDWIMTRSAMYQVHLLRAAINDDDLVSHVLVTFLGNHFQLFERSKKKKVTDDV